LLIKVDLSRVILSKPNIPSGIRVHRVFVKLRFKIKSIATIGGTTKGNPFSSCKPVTGIGK
jgi:hypothetical protein